MTIVVEEPSNDVKESVKEVEEPVKKVEVVEIINIVMCSYNRVNNLSKILYSLDEQTVHNRIHLHILNKS